MLDRLLRESHPEAGGFKHNYQSVRVVDRLEKRYDEPGLNLTHDVREGILKHTAWKVPSPSRSTSPRGCGFESGGTLEAQIVNWSDEIAQQTHDLEDGLPLAEEAAIEELAIARLVRAARGYGQRPRRSRRASLIRGMIAMLTADLVGRLARPDRALARDSRRRDGRRLLRAARPPARATSSASRSRARALPELKEFVYRHIIHSFPVSRHDGHARRVMAGLFGAYRENPRLLPDDVLRGLERDLGVRFLREVPLGAIEREVAERYRPRPEFYRAIADHIAGMTDSYCNAEYRELVVGVDQEEEPMPFADAAPLAFMDRDLAVVDPDVARWIAAEARRQNEGLELIASENWVSRAVREAQGSVLTNKYAEGYPGKRYYGGCEFVDKVEPLAIDRAKALFGAEHANVQPHSGSQANMAVYLTALQARRHDPRHGPLARRPPDARPPALLLGPGVQGRRLRRAPRGRAHRLRRAGARWPASTGRSSSSRAPRPTRGRSTSRGSARWPTEVGAALMVRHRAHRGPRDRGTPHVAGAARAVRHDDDAQDAARAARAGSSSAGRDRAKDLDRNVFPGMQGGPLEHVIAAKAVAFAEAATPEFVDVPEADRREREGPRGGAARAAASASSRAAPTTT